MSHEELLREAIRLSIENVQNGGGPFGAVVARDGVIVATGVNRVTATNDPTAHAEVSAIRAACTALGSFVLTGCTLYTSCEPCPMCLGAVYWAHLDAIYFAANRTDAALAGGFDDDLIYKEFEQPIERRLLLTVPLDHLRNEANEAFHRWRSTQARTHY